MIKEYTLCIIKPDACEKRYKIISEICNYSFDIKASKELNLTEEDVRKLYSKQKIEKFNGLIDFMTSGKCLALVLEKENACVDFRKLVNEKKYDENGKKIKTQISEDLSSQGILRQKFGTDTLRNAVHGSNNPKKAKKEMKIFFTKDEMKFFKF